MRKLLQSKIFVGIMVVAAVVFVGRNFIPASVTYPASTSAGTEPEEEEFMEIGDEEVDEVYSNSVPLNPPTMASKHFNNWRDTFRPVKGISDPFAAVKNGRAVSIVFDGVDSSATEEQIHIDAITVTSRRAVAVINGRVLIVGDSIGEYQVEQISADTVVLSGPEGSRKVFFERQTKPSFQQSDEKAEEG